MYDPFLPSDLLVSYVSHSEPKSLLSIKKN